MSVGLVPSVSRLGRTGCRVVILRLNQAGIIGDWVIMGVIGEVWTELIVVII